MSRLLVGSSSTRKFASVSISRAICRRLFSPPLSLPIGCACVVVGEQQAPQDADRLLLGHRLERRARTRAASGRAAASPAPARSSRARRWRRSSASRASAAPGPVTARSSVVLPLPFGPTTPDPLAVAHDQVERPEQRRARRRFGWPAEHSSTFWPLRVGVEDDLDALAAKDRPLGGGRLALARPAWPCSRRAGRTSGSCWPSA